MPVTMFGVAEDTSLRVDLPYNDLIRRSFCYAAGNGDALIGNPEAPLLRLTVISTTPNVFAVFFSVSHVVADGYTFYKLWTMLSESAEPYAMSIGRRQTFSTDLDRVLEPNDG